MARRPLKVEVAPRLMSLGRSLSCFWRRALYLLSLSSLKIWRYPAEAKWLRLFSALIGAAAPLLSAAVLAPARSSVPAPENLVLQFFRKVPARLDLVPI